MKFFLLLLAFTLATLQHALAMLLEDSHDIWDPNWGFEVPLARGRFLGAISREPQHQKWGRAFFVEVALPKIQANQEVKGSDWNAWLNEKMGSAGASGTSQKISGAVEEAGSLISKIRP